MNISHLELLVGILTSFIASSGFWTWMNRRRDKHDQSNKLLIGLTHDRIVYLSEKYINRGWITHDEYENLHVYLYQPYVAMDGNGSAKRLMEIVDKLPNNPPKGETKDDVVG